MSDPRTPPSSGAQILRGSGIDETAKAFFEKELNFFNEIERLVKHFYNYDVRTGKFTTLKPNQDFVVEGRQLTALQQRAIEVLLEPYRDLINEKEAILKRDDSIPETDYLARIETIATNKRYNKLMRACMENSERFSEFNFKDVLKSIPTNPEQSSRILTVNSIVSRPAAHLIEIKDFGKSVHKMAGKSNESVKSGIAASIHNAAQHSLIKYEESHIDYKTKIRDLMSDLDALVKKKASDDDIADFTKLNDEIKKIGRLKNVSDNRIYESMIKKINEVLRWHPEITLASMKPPEILTEIAHIPNNTELMDSLRQLINSEPKYSSSLDASDSLLDSIRGDIILLHSDFVDDKIPIINRLYENLARFERRIQSDIKIYSRDFTNDEIQRMQTQLILLEQIIPNKNILISAQPAVAPETISTSMQSTPPDLKGKGRAVLPEDRQPSVTNPKSFTSNVSSTGHFLQRVGIPDTKDRAARSSKHEGDHARKKHHDRGHHKKEHHAKSNNERVSFSRPSTTGKKSADQQTDPSKLYSEAKSTDKLKRPPTASKKPKPPQTDPQSVFSEAKSTDTITRPRRGGR